MDNNLYTSELIDKLINNLDYIKNLEILETEKDIPFQFYFDTKDFIQIIMGIQSYPEYKKDEALREDERMVHAFVTCGIFPNGIKLLPTHQEEFHHYLSINLGSKEVLYEDSPNTKLEFINETKIHISDEGKKYADLTPKQREVYIKERIDKSLEIFVAATILFQIDWKKRLKYLFKNRSILKIVNYNNFSYNKIIESDIYLNLKKSFDKIRTLKYSLNNIYDAIALTYISQLLTDFKNKKNSVLPIIYDSTGTFIQVISDANVYDMFCIEHNNKKFSIIRDSKYFLAYGIFNGLINNFKNTEVNNYNNLIAHIEIVQNFINKYNISRTTKDPFKLVKLEKEIEDYKNYNFFKDVLIKYLGDQFLGHAFVYFIEDSQVLKEKAVINEIENYISKFKSELEARISNIVNFREVFVTLRNKINDRIKNLKTSATYVQHINPIRHFGIIRFPIEKKILSKLEKEFDENSIYSEIDYEYEASLDNFLNAFLIGLMDQKNTDNFIYGLCGLWCLELFEEIIIYINKITPETNNINLRIIKAATYAKTAQLNYTNYIEETINNLNIEIKKYRRNSLKKVQFLTTIAYLKFYLAKVYDPRINKYYFISTPTNSTSQIIEESVELAFKAYNCSLNLNNNDSNVMTLKLFSLDMYLFYSISGADDNKFCILNENIEELFNLKDEMRGLWQFRYDDTLGRYYHRLARITNEKEYWKSAMEFNKAAHITSNNDPETGRYWLFFLSEYNKINL
ncbi:MAG: hypothetical protein JXA68_05790 [Ignavibacteriales bacterium]|nr:hypothetical protein [Ignavibacteriales bacterium]